MLTTRRMLIDDGDTTLDVYVAEDADLDGTFDAVCAYTGDDLRINGWMTLDIEDISDKQN